MSAVSRLETAANPLPNAFIDGQAYFWSWLFLLILPFSYVAVLRKRAPLLPVSWETIYHISGVFSGRVTRWRCNYIEVKFEGGKNWAPLRTDPYSRIYPSGWRNRLDRMLDDSNGKRGALTRERMAAYIAGRHEQLFPSNPWIEELRFVRVWFSTGEPGMARPEQGWAYPPLPFVPAGDRKILSTHRFYAGKAVDPVIKFDAPDGFSDADLIKLVETRGRLDSLVLSQAKISRSSLATAIKKWPNLAALELRGTACKDDWVRDIASLGTLARLDVADTLVTDASASELVKLAKLKTLYLTNTPVSDWTVARLTGLKQLEALSIGKTKITANGLAAISQWPVLERLLLYGTAIKGGDVSKLGGSRSLLELSLADTGINDPDIYALSRFPNLRKLDLSGTKVGLEGLAGLTVLGKLEEVDLRRTSFTKESVAFLANHPKLLRVITDAGQVKLTPKVKPMHTPVTRPPVSRLKEITPIGHDKAGHSSPAQGSHPPVLMPKP